MLVVTSMFYRIEKHYREKACIHSIFWSYIILWTRAPLKEGIRDFCRDHMPAEWTLTPGLLTSQLGPSILWSGSKIPQWVQARRALCPTPTLDPRTMPLTWSHPALIPPLEPRPDSLVTWTNPKVTWNNPKHTEELWLCYLEQPTPASLWPWYSSSRAIWSNPVCTSLLVAGEHIPHSGL